MKRNRLLPEVLRRETRGRPALTFDYEEIEALAADGLSQEQIAQSVGASRRTVQKRVQDDPLFDAAIKRGRSTMRRVLANGLFTQAKRGNLTALIFLSKVHLEWKEDRPPPSQMSPSQMAQAVKDELTKLEAEA